MGYFISLRALFMSQLEEIMFTMCLVGREKLDSKWGKSANKKHPIVQTEGTVTGESPKEGRVQDTTTDH